MRTLDTTTSSPPPAEESRDSDEDEEESLSLCDFPVMTRNGFPCTDSHQSNAQGLPREPRLPPPSSPTSDHFEFVRGHGSEMCAADDVFLRGQLLPYNKPPLTTPAPLSTRTSHGHVSDKFPSDHERFPQRHIRSESLDGFERSRGGGAATRCWKSRGSLSADYQKLPKRSVGSCDVSAPSRARPKWYVFVFGSVRVPGEMDMKDIRSRQRRRNPSSLRVSHDGGRTDSASVVGCQGKTGGGGPWSLLRSLSCRGGVDGVVTAPLST